MDVKEESFVMCATSGQVPHLILQVSICDLELFKLVQSWQPSWKRLHSYSLILLFRALWLDPNLLGRLNLFSNDRKVLSLRLQNISRQVPFIIILVV
jgi:hypothetical protein